MKSYLLGIDIGTGGCKTTILDSTGAFVSDGFAEYPTYHPKVGWSEQKATSWFPAFLSSLHIALEKGSVPPSAIIALCISASAHNAVLLDADGSVIRDTIMWTDQRSHDESEYLKAHFSESIFRISYQTPAPTWTLPQLMWIRRNEPEVFSRIHRLMFIKDYVRYQLTGNWCTDHIEAQGSMLFDNGAWKWSEELCAIGEIPARILPPIVEPQQVSGHITSEASRFTGIPEGTPVINGATDTALEHYCVGAIEEGACVVKVATASTVNIFGETAQPHPSGMTYSQIPKGLWSTCFATNSAAASLRWYRDTFCAMELREEITGGENVYSILDEEAAAVAPGSAGLFFHPHLMGERSPHWDPKLRGSFVGITAHHTRGHFNRAILEGVAFSIKENFEIAETLQPVQEICLVGGGAKSRIWTGIVADVLNKPIVKFEKDDSSYGAAMLAGVGVGVFESHEQAIAKCRKLIGRIQPTPENAAAYEKAFALYCEIHADLKKTYNKL